MMTRRTAALAACLVLLLAACDSSDKNAGAGGATADKPVAESRFDACALLTSEEIESTLGWKVAQTKPKSFGANGSCTYQSANPYANGTLQQVSLVVAPGMPGMDSASAMVEWRKKQYEGDAYKEMHPVVEPVEGLGVPAIRNGVENFFALEMTVNNRLVSLTVSGSLDQAKALGKQVVSRLK